MKNVEIASRYAKALFSVSEELGQTDETITEISELASVFSDPELKSHLNSPIVTNTDKKAIVDRLLSSAKFSESTGNFLRLLTDKSRLGVLGEISLLLVKYSDYKKGLVRGEVRYADQLTQEDKQSIEERVGSTLNKKLLLEYKQDPSVLGGVVVKVGDYTIDFSVNRQLERIRESLNAGVQ